MTEKVNHYDVIVVGGGHAGVEAAHAAARIGLSTALITMELSRVAQMSCNPAIGGLAKGQIVREVDALGGVMGLAADRAGIQFRMLNRSKGPAVWSPRAQADINLYIQAVLDILSRTDNLTLIEGTVESLIIDEQCCKGVVLKSSERFSAGAVVLTTGTFLRAVMHTGEKQWPGGRFDEDSADALSLSLLDAGIPLERLKTGTPARLDADSIDYDVLQMQPGDDEPEPFSFLNTAIDREQVPCWITYTNETTHEIITSNLDRAPLYTGQIKSIGPRYCPSIETKIQRFADKTRHQLFLEPEGLDTNWVYCNGLSTSLPEDVQDAMIHSIVGLEHARVLRYGYAIEYDYVPPTQTRSTLESKAVSRLFLAGQINGTSGYEEAAGQGLVAGVNAARSVLNQEPVILTRDQAYIGVMIDDLVTKGVDEPYRMFTSRAEHRLLLRSDNADQRLTPIGREWGVVDDERWQVYVDKAAQMQVIGQTFALLSRGGKSLNDLLRQQNHDSTWLLREFPELEEHQWAPAALNTVINDVRYSGYVEKQQRLVKRFQKAERVRLPQNYDYHQVEHLRFEAREKLNHIQPQTLGQASRISGINPADLTVLMIHLQKKRLIDSPHHQTDR